MSLLYAQYLLDYSGMSTSGVARSITNMAGDFLDKVLTDNEFTALTDKTNDFMARGVSGSYNLPEKIQIGLAKDPYYPFMSDVFSELSTELEMMNNLIHAGIVGGFGPGFAQWLEGLMQTDQLLRIYRGGAYQFGVAPFVARYYLGIYTPNQPDMRQAFEMLQRGNLNRTEFNELLREEGWPGKWWDKIYNVLIKTPQPWDAFSWYRRGIIDEDSLDTWLKAYGIYDGDLDFWKEGLFRTPSLGELTRISDYVELSSVYLGEKLKGAGYQDEDVALITTALQKRPNREEVRGMTTELVWMYQHGRMSEDDLGTAFDDLGLLPTEKTLDLERAQLQYTQQLIQEGLQVVEYRVYKKDPALLTIANIKTEIEALGVNEETSNLIAAQYYYHYIYSP